MSQTAQRVEHLKTPAPRLGDCGTRPALTSPFLTRGREEIFTGLLANFHGSFIASEGLSNVHRCVSRMGNSFAWGGNQGRGGCLSLQQAGRRPLRTAGTCLGIPALCMRLTDDQQSHATVANTKATRMLFFPLPK